VTTMADYDEWGGLGDDYATLAEGGNDPNGPDFYLDMFGTSRSQLDKDEVWRQMDDMKIDNEKLLKLADPALPVEPGTYDGDCVECGTKTTDAWFLWCKTDMTVDLEVRAVMPNDTYVLLCTDCHVELQKEIVEGPPKTTFQSGWEKWKAGNATPGAKLGGTTSTYKPKCDKPHFDKVLGPEGYGYLRLSSVRGGMYVDTDADYGLFFDRNWKRMSEGAVEFWNPKTGTDKTSIPDLSGDEDMSDWPEMAFIDWPDMAGPPEWVERYATWAHEQWKAGRNIQFGCYGAHGRTGTFLGMLLHKAGMIGADIISDTRALSCEGTIESGAQKAYLLKLNGQEVPKPPTTTTYTVTKK
jgi:hypothetical protein